MKMQAQMCLLDIAFIESPLLGVAFASWFIYEWMSDILGRSVCMLTTLMEAQIKRG